MHPNSFAMSHIWCVTMEAAYNTFRTWGGQHNRFRWWRYCWTCRWSLWLSWWHRCWWFRRFRFFRRSFTFRFCCRYIWRCCWIVNIVSFLAIKPLLRVHWFLKAYIENFVILKKKMSKDFKLKSHSSVFIKEWGEIEIIYFQTITMSHGVYKKYGPYCMGHTVWSIHRPDTSKNGIINDPISDEHVLLHENGFNTLKINSCLRSILSRFHSSLILGSNWFFGHFQLSHLKLQKIM